MWEEGRTDLEGSVGTTGKEWNSRAGWVGVDIWGRDSTGNTAGEYLGREDALSKISSGRKNLVSTTGLGK